MTVTDLRVPVAGGELFVRRWSPGADETRRAPILLLHDSLGSVELWREFPAALAGATGLTVLAYDRLGFGQSTPRTGRPAPGFIQEEADLYFPALADALGLASVILFGHSVGGAMALAIAATHPARCHAVITESAQALVEPRTLEGIRKAKALFTDAGQLARLAKWHGERAPWVLDAWTETWLSPEFQSWTLDPILPKVRCPVLAIHGDADEYGSADFPRRIAAGVRGPSRSELLVSCGHVPHREKEREVLELARGFIAQHPG